MNRPTGLPRFTSGASTPLRNSSECLTAKPPSSSASPSSRDWIIGDRCYLNGTKAARIAFLGETRFGQGDWAGLVLDEPTGKNDGSVNGIRYFQCAQNFGIFCRLDKLTRDLASSQSDNLDITMRESSTPPDHSTPNNRSPIVDLSSLPPFAGGVKLGDRVAVSGSLDKVGQLVYLGQTKFADGQWAGIELDHPVGKNDGSVQNVRYFSCKPKHGVFVPVSKVVAESRRYSAGSTSNLSMISVGSTAKPPSLAVRHNVSSMLRMQKGGAGKMGSQESLCSVGSVQSSVASKRIRLGVAALQSPISSTPRRDVLPSISDSNHEECHKNLATVKLQMDQLYLSLEQATSECKKLENLYEEEKKKAEDLHFRLEEESIAKLQQETKIAELEALLTGLNANDKSSAAAMANLTIDDTLNQTEITRLTAALEKVTFDCKTFEKLCDDEKLKIDALMASRDEQVELRAQAEKKLQESLEQVSGLKSTIGLLEKTIAELRTSQPEQEKLLIENLDLKKKHMQLQQKFDNTEKALANKNSELERIVKQNEVLTYEIAKVKQNAGQSNSELLQKLSTMENVLIEKDGLLSRLGTEKSENLAHMKEIEEENGRLRNELPAHSENTKKITDDYNLLKLELSKCQSTLKESETRESRLFEEIKNIQAEKANLQMTLEDLNERSLGEINELKANLAASRNSIEALMNEKAQLAGEKASLLAKVDLLNAQSGAEKDAKHAEFTAKIEKLTLDAEKMGNYSKNLADQNTQLNEANSKLQFEISKLKEDYKLASQQSENSEGKRKVDHQAALTEIEDLKEKLRSSEAFMRENEQLRASLSDCEQSNLVLKTQIAKYANDLQASNMQLSQLGPKSAQLEELMTTRLSLESKINELQAEKTEALQENKSLQSSLQSERDQNATLSDKALEMNDTERHLKADVEKLESDKEAMQLMLSELNHKLDESQKESMRYSEAAEKQRLENERLKIENHQISERVDQFYSQIKEFEERNSKLQSELNCNQEAESKLIDLTKDVGQLCAEKRNLELKCTELQSKLDQMETELIHLNDSFNRANQKYDDAIVASTQYQIENRDMLKKLALIGKEAEQRQEYILKSQTENLSLKQKIDCVEKDNQNLMHKLNNAGRKFVENDSVDQQPLDSDENDQKIDLNNQISFLNSVIADLTKKNQELSMKVDIFYNQGAADALGLNKFVTKKQPKPRLFCDICEVFDAHETEDCPKQSNSGDDVINERRHAKRVRKDQPSRPYCEHCEAFGHDTESCDKNLDSY